MPRLFSHVDLRVRNLAATRKFYDAFLAEFGFKCVTEPPFTEEEPTWRREGWHANDEFIGLTVDPEFVPNQTRIAFHATSRKEVDRITHVLRDSGALDIDGPVDYEGYYATFFEDPDGNKMEICYLTHHRGIAGAKEILVTK